MSQIIVDAGSTKCDWRLIDGEHLYSVQTTGLNPYFLTEEEICQTIFNQVIPLLPGLTIRHIYFYGAGCGAMENKLKIKAALKRSFPHAEIFVETDLLGACRALLHRKQGFVIILGTGSGSGFYDGENIIDSIDSLGYVLGDEGSGAHIGRLLLRSWLRGLFSANMEIKFVSKYQYTRDETLNHLYHDTHPNRFLAQFAHFALENTENSMIKQIVYSAIAELFDQVIIRYHNVHQYSINFSGSVAGACRSIIQEKAEIYKLQIGSIIKSPIDELVLYHNNQI
ncbi:MAG: hypothetical protein H0W62_09005 [Chitinophagales bacterium]|nr:hypothetical protein [Chitinophagales bacterium]